MPAHLHPLRRVVALVSSLLVLQLTLAGGPPCAGDSVAGAVSSGTMAGMDMGGQEMQDTGAPPCTSAPDCAPSHAGNTCQAMTSCAPSFTAATLQLSAASGPKADSAPGGRLLAALTRAPSLDPPPPKG